MDIIWHILFVAVQIFAAFALVVPVIWLICSLFWKGNVGKTMRKSCLAHLAIVAIPFIFILIISILRGCENIKKEQINNEITK